MVCNHYFWRYRNSGNSQFLWDMRV